MEWRRGISGLRWRGRRAWVGLWACGLAAAGCSGPVGPGEHAADRPDILLISLDTVRADHLTPYGYARDTTPALRRFAEQGALFTRSWSQSSSTVPTHASLFTSLWPHQHGVFAYPESLPEDAVTLTEHLRDHGYRTFCFASSTRFHAGSGFFQGCDVSEAFEEDPKNSRSARVNRRALAEMGRDDGAPFFGFLHYVDAHEPYAPPEPFRFRWHAGLEAPRPEETSEFLQAHRWPAREVSPEVLDYLRGLYDGAISYQDAALAELFAALDATPRGRDVLVVITSDHGEEFKEHGGLSHAVHLHEELVRVPLLVRWFGRIAPGRRLEAAAQTVDIFPMLTDLASVPTPPGIVGRSFADALLGRVDPESPRSRRDALELVVLQQSEETWALSATLSTGRFKLLVHRGGEPALFRLDEDPRGLSPVDAEYGAEKQQLLKISRQLQVGTAEGRMLGPLRVPEDPEVLERLRSLGYTR
ncbi:MAG: sulfatase [Acidobacteriota bacterium]